MFDVTTNLIQRFFEWVSEDYNRLPVVLSALFAFVATGATAQTLALSRRIWDTKGVSVYPVGIIEDGAGRWLRVLVVNQSDMPVEITGIRFFRYERRIQNELIAAVFRHFELWFVLDKWIGGNGPFYKRSGWGVCINERVVTLREEALPYCRVTTTGEFCTFILEERVGEADLNLCKIEVYTHHGKHCWYVDYVQHSYELTTTKPFLNMPRYG